MKAGLKVLIVDDEPINLDILNEMLGDKCETSLASSGEEALKMASRTLPDLVLLDVMMPGINGYKTCERLRANEQFEGMKIIMISANADQSAIKQGLESGADEYVPKPFDEDTLLEIINRYVD